MKNEFRRLIRYGVIAFLFICMIGVYGCAAEEPPANADTTVADETTLPAANTDLPDTADTEDTPDTTAAQTQTPEPDTPVYINRLTGEAADEATYYKRPLAIMINNIRKANPQIGISNAMVIYECEVEGGITRLMMLTTDYESLPVTGSIRSAREYFIDYAMGHDAIFMHAGGSDQAYRELKSRGVDNIDGTNGRNPYDTFYRDQNRLATMGAVHSLVSTGDRIVKAIQYHDYRTVIEEDTQTSFRFVAPGTSYTLDGGVAATHVYMSYTASYHPEFVYDAQTNTYLRYQFDHLAQTDSATGEQLAFTNVLLLSCTRTYLNDDKGHVDIVTAGEGDGYYIYGGKAISIRWKKANDDAPLLLYTADGAELLLNTGKTFVNVLSDSQFAKAELNRGVN